MSAHPDDMTTTCDHGWRAETTCGGCGASWCAECDPCPSALCHYCHGRGYSTAERTPPAEPVTPDRWMESPTIRQRFDNGATIYRVTVEFSNGFASHDHPSGWDWASLLDEPDARAVEVTERANPDWQMESPTA